MTDLKEVQLDDLGNQLKDAFELLRITKEFLAELMKNEDISFDTFVGASQIKAQIDNFYPDPPTN